MTLMNTLRCAAAFSVLTIAAVAEARDDDRGSKNDVTQTFDFQDFDKINIAGVYDLDVTVGEDYAISMSGSEKEMARTKVSVSSGTLTLSNKKQNGRKKSRNQKSVDVNISMPSLTGFNVSGVVDGDIEGVDSENLKLKLSGVGDITIEGTCGMLDARISGVGDLDAENLRCRNVEVVVSGVGDASVYASESVDARVSGLGDVDVYGKPKNVETSDGMLSNVNIR